MNRKNTLASLLVVLISSVLFFSCEKDNSIYGEGLISGELFETSKAFYDVGLQTKKLTAVQTSELSLYQLGNFRDPIYGTTSAKIAAQVRLSSINPIFGTYKQSDEGTAIASQENERTTSAELYIPFVLGTDKDSDFDGLIDAYDIDPEDPDSDSDGDGVTDIDEYNKGTDPLNQDTDGDGILDDVDTEYIGSTFAKTFDLDSIYGNLDADLNLKVKKLDYYLDELDAATNFLEKKTYYSNQNFEPFTSTVLFDDVIQISNKEYVYYKEDDPDTEDVDESLEVDYRKAPGIRVMLDPKFFDRYLLGQEGSDNLLSQSNFVNFMRGIHLSIGASDELMMLLNLTQAEIRVNYKYDNYNSDDELVEKSSFYTLNLLTQTQTGVVGIAVNSFETDAYQGTVIDQIQAVNPSRLYLKGGVGTVAEINLFEGLDADAVIEEIRTNNWIINEAKLVFYVDRNALDAAGQTYEPPRLYMYNARTKANLINIGNESYDDDSYMGVFTNFDGRIQKELNKGIKYEIRLTDHINNIILRDSLNDPLRLEIASDVRYHEFNKAMEGDDSINIHKYTATTPLGTVLYGNGVSQAEEDKKLRLELNYSISN